MIIYNDTITLVEVQSSGYSNSKTAIDQQDISGIFLQNTAFSRSNFQEGTDSDAICYLDPENQFLIDHSYRVEGMYILSPLFCADEDEAWYKVTKVIVNRDHLLNNEIDNVQLLLKKTSKVAGVTQCP